MVSALMFSMIMTGKQQQLDVKKIHISQYVYYTAY